MSLVSAGVVGEKPKKERVPFGDPFLFGIACAVLVLAGLTLAELEALACSRLTWLLTFLLAGVAGEHSGLLERRA